MGVDGEQEKDWGGAVKITNRKIHSALPTVERVIANNGCDKGFEVIRDALTAQSINFSDDFNFLQPNF